MKDSDGYRKNEQVRKGSLKQFFAAVMAVFMMLAMVPVNVHAQEEDDYIFGTMHEYSTYGKEELNDTFYYSDSWFERSPEERNDELALASMQLTAAAVSDDENGYGAEYLRKIGFEEIGFERFQSSDPDDCSYTWARKKVDGADPYTLVVIAFQSYSEDPMVKAKAWMQDFTVNDETASGEHAAFARAVDIVIDEIAALANDAKVKYWITGQSRCGALTNLLAAKLPAKLGSANAGVFAYTFESPATVDGDMAKAGEYGYIHNYICHDDIVPRIPFWGMARYGNVYDLKTEETDARLIDELEKLGSTAAGLGEVPDLTEHVETLVKGLEARVPARADYSKTNTDVFADEEGNVITVTYAYQDVFRKLMYMIFSGELEGIEASRLMDDIDALAPYVYALAEGVRKEQAGNQAEADAYYWAAGKGVHAVMNQLSQEPVSFDDTDFYTLLKIAGPMLVDTEYEPTGSAGSDVIGYLLPVVMVVSMADSLVYSHHFDTLVARLKTMAPAFVMAEADLVIEAPQADDALTKAPEEIAAAVSASWQTAEAEWLTEDSTLQDGKVYYLQVTVKAVGHTIPEDVKFTVNGQQPCLAPEIVSVDAVEQATALFRFEIGTPETFTVSFESDGSGKAPDVMPVMNGTMLKTVEAPVMEDEDSRKFFGWLSEDGTPWDEIEVHEDMTLKAKWRTVVDEIQIFFAKPQLNDPATPPTVPEDALYEIYGFTISDPDWEDAERYDRPGTYHLDLTVALKDPENSVFLTEPDEWGVSEFMGMVKLNGEEVYVHYEEEENRIYVSFSIDLTQEGEEPVITYSVVEGDGQEWVKGTDAGLRFVVRRSAADEETYGLFKDLAIDDEILEASQYECSSGSLIADVYPVTLEALSAGEHTLTAFFEDGTASAKFTVAEKTVDPEPIEPTAEPEEPAHPGEKTPNTRDTTDSTLWGILMMMGMAGTAVLSLVLKKYAHR